MHALSEHAPHAHATPGQACKAMRDAGLAEVNPSHPTLMAVMAQDMTVEELAQAAAEAVKRGKGFAWALERAIGQRRDAARVNLAPATPATTLVAAIMARETQPEPDDGPDVGARD